MATIMLQAHFDGERIRLDEPFDLPANVPLLITVLPAAPRQHEDEGATGWNFLAATALARAYGDDEPEYSEADLRP